MRIKNFKIRPILLLLGFVVWPCSAISQPKTVAEGAATLPIEIDTGAVAQTFSAVNNRSRENVLNWLTAQKNGCEMMVGQHIGHGYGTPAGYQDLVLELEQQSGRRMGLVEADYFDWDYAEDVEAFNQPLKEHWNAGGLVGVNWSAPNPWTGGDVWDQQNANLDELLNPNSAVGQEWLRQLDFAASGLEDLQDAGAVVLFRPLHEMNGDWFWWGANVHPNDNGPYVRLWRHMHQYFTETKGLDNLIWVYATSTYNGESWKAPVDFYYPGGDVVDIVAIDVYDDDVNVDGYDQLLALGKPIAIAEVGPMASRDGSYDNLYMLQQILDRYPEAIYFLTWHGWMENGEYQHLPVAHNRNSSELMNHECVTTLDEMSFDGGANTELPQSGKLLIPYGVPSPTIDGVMDEIWQKVPEHAIDNQLSGSQSTTDISGQFRMLYDRSNIYVMIEVQDDVLQSDSGSDWWEDDGIEIYIDADLSGGEGWDGRNDYLLGFRIWDNEPKIGGFSAEMPSSLEFGQTQKANGYLMEIKIPLSTMGYQRSNSGRFGIDIHINDDDDGGGRDGKVGWFAQVDDSWQRPASFGIGYLMDRVVYLPVLN